METHTFKQTLDNGGGPYIGIQIDGNERILINDFTVMHSSINILSKLSTVKINHPGTGKRYTQSWAPSRKPESRRT